MLVRTGVVFKFFITCVEISSTSILYPFPKHFTGKVKMRISYSLPIYYVYSKLRMCESTRRNPHNPIHKHILL